MVTLSSKWMKRVAFLRGSSVYVHYLGRKRERLQSERRWPKRSAWTSFHNDLSLSHRLSLWTPRDHK
jgi:hypothetical protein